MYQIITDIIGHNWASTNSNEQTYIYQICGALIILFTIFFIDLVYRVFSHFWK